MLEISEVSFLLFHEPLHILDLNGRALDWWSGDCEFKPLSGNFDEIYFVLCNFSLTEMRQIKNSIATHVRIWYTFPIKRINSSLILRFIEMANKINCM